MLIWADRLRILATLMVIAIHVAGPVSQQNTEYNSWFWWAGNFWDGVSRPSVPLFTMLSGFLLLGKDYPTGSFLKKRFSRVLIPGLFWMIVYCYYDYSGTGSPATIAEAARGILQRSVHYHLWYIYLIVGLYLMYPLLRPWARNARDEDYWYVFALFFCGTWLYKFLYQFLGLSIGIYWEFFTNQGGYFILGYYLGSKPLPGETPVNANLRPWPLSLRQMWALALSLIVLSSTVTLVGTYWASLAYGGKFHAYFYDYLTPNVGLSAMGWFLLARLAFNKGPMLPVEQELAAASFGMFLLHPMIIDWWSLSGYWHSRAHPAQMIPMVICLVTLVVFVAVLLIRALPGGKRIT